MALSGEASDELSEFVTFERDGLDGRIETIIGFQVKMNEIFGMIGKSSKCAESFRSIFIY
jgi:hypothetical protein